jgi:Protein of unknown function (DUF3365)
MKRIAFFTVSILIVIGCNSNDAGNNKQDADELAAYVKQGDSIVKITFDTLRNTLFKTIGEKGLRGALIFCNAQALPITKIYASEGIAVSRISDKNRNPENGLSEFDKIEWGKYINNTTRKDSLKPVVIFNDSEAHYYKPILMQPFCLSCHGTPEKEIAKALLPVIDSLYPADKAKGYKAGDLRGMWHIVFTKQIPGKK